MDLIFKFDLDKEITDFIYNRYGGEEYLIKLPENSINIATQYREKPYDYRKGG